MFALNIEPVSNHPSSQVGGGAFVPDSFEWPRDSHGLKLLPILTIRQDIFLIPTIPDGLCVTVFAPFAAVPPSRASIRSCAVNGIDQLKLGSDDGMKVYLHDDTGIERFLDDRQHLPATALVRRAMTDAESKEDLEDEINGLYVSKVVGRPSWLQDEIYISPKYGFEVQITENDLRRVDPSYEGVFSDGSCYLYLLKSIKKLKPGSIAGECFVQFT